MESMNGFLLHVAEADEEDYQVGAWMKQVAEFAYASQNSVDRYMQSLGAGRREPGFLGHCAGCPSCPRYYESDLSKLLIDVGEDHGGQPNLKAWIGLREESTEAAAFLEKVLAALDIPLDQFDAEAAQLQPNKEEELIGLPQLNKEEEVIGQPQPKEKEELIGQPQPKEKEKLIAQLQPNEEEELITQLQPKEKEELIAHLQSNEEEFMAKLQPKGMKMLIAQLQQHLKGKRSLWNNIKSAFPHENCSPGSAIVITTRSIDVAQSFSPTGNLDLNTGSHWYLGRAIRLMNINSLGALPCLSTNDYPCQSGFNIKLCTVPNDILEIVTQIAREDHFVKNNHHPDLIHRLSVHYEGQPHQAEKEVNVTRSQACWNICGHQATVEQSNATQEFLESLPSSSHSGILKVLDLENCDELKDHHLKNICNYVFHLKYLSLRYTDITELPKQLDKLQSLETLDIRDTNVKAFAKNSVFLPKLKHLLAGYWTSEEIDVNGNNVQSKEMLSTVAMPKHIGNMTELQVISHIAASGDGSELKYVGYLLQLVKLGVFFSGSKTSVLRHLYYATGNLGFLRSLSIQVAETEEENENVNKKDASPIYPKYHHKLKISGLKNGLPSWVEKLKVLAKMTLHRTSITDDDFEIIGLLTCLSGLRLRQESCNESTLTFKKDAFQSLEFLDVEYSAITCINFDNEACPKLKKLVWYSTREQSLSGIERLPALQELKLTGRFDEQSVMEAVNASKNIILFNH
ncbi:hypothetical protein TRIUR3_08615 [Triticum urartu]|uniref:Disease resistance R13L4/SHOC-2-like LRR domain-containing protein n=1 Tax=Triticum urartu TaxID=4572 RepID=M7ZTC3_TRIUA|nr:hypothetical protein TRIUR3_08615 [Triticum urartu]